MSTLGIDFGTSYSSASYVKADGKPEAIRFIGHDLKMPSIVLFYNNQTMIGYDAEYMVVEGLPGLPVEEQRRLSSGAIKSIKRDLDIDGRVCNHSHKDIVTMILGHIRKEALKACAPQQFEKLVLTHPVRFEERKKQLLKEAAHAAGFQNVELLQEPISAAIGYLRHEGIEDVKGMLVYDWGAGTFDVAYVTKHEGRFIVPLPAKGDANCGGDDLDAALYDYLTDKAAPIIGNEYKVRRELNLLMQCRRWKEMLSSIENLPVTILSKQDPTKRFTSILTRAEFERLALPIVSRTITITKEVFDEIKENRLPIDFILLIGGSSQLPIIKEQLTKALSSDVKIRSTGTVDIAVALGASYFGQNPIEINPEKEWCYCMYDGRKILRSYNFCIYCGKPNFYKTKKF